MWHIFSSPIRSAAALIMHPQLPIHADHRRPTRQWQTALSVLLSLVLVVLLHFTGYASAAPSHIMHLRPAVLTKEVPDCVKHDIIPHYTVAQQDNTFAFLAQFPYTIPALREKWVCRNFCDWDGVHCSPVGVEVHLDSRRLVGWLPEVPSTVDTVQVIVTRFVVEGEGDGIESGLPKSWRNLDQLTSLEIRLDYRETDAQSLEVSSTAHSTRTVAAAVAAYSSTEPDKCVIPRNAVNVSLAHNRISGPLPPTFPECNPSLKYLYLHDNTGLRGSIPEEWGRWTSLEIINIKNTSVCGCPPKEWATFSPPVMINAEVTVTDPTLCLVSCGSAPSSSSGSSGESSSRSECYGPVPFYSASQQAHTRSFLESFKDTIEDLQPLWACPNFCVWVYVSCTPEGVAVEITGTEFIGYVPEVAAGVDPAEVVVTKLDFSRSTWVEGDYPASWASLALLQSVSFAYTSLSGTLPSEWGAMPALRYLDLSFTWSGGVFPGSWSSLGNLEVLKLVHLTIFDQLPDSWSSMTALRELDVSSGSVSGTLPSSWGSLTNLEVVSLHHNNIRSRLPSSWDSLTQLQTLLLHNNQFVGSIPETYGEMSSLSRVGLEVNNFCGCLPSAWAAKQGLSMTITAQPEVLASDCATANSCSLDSSSSSSSSDHKSTSSSSSTTTTRGPTPTPTPTPEPVLPSSSSSVHSSSDTDFYDRLYHYCPNVQSVSVEAVVMHRNDICCSEWNAANYTTTCGDDIKSFSNAIVTCSGALGSRGPFSCCSRVGADGVGKFLGVRCEEVDGKGDSTVAPQTWRHLHPSNVCVLATLTAIIVLALF